MASNYIIMITLICSYVNRLLALVWHVAQNRKHDEPGNETGDRVDATGKYRVSICHEENGAIFINLC